MTAHTIRTALGILQDEPDNEQAWNDLRDALGYAGEGGTVDPGELGASTLAELLEQARNAHQMRREYEAVADLLEIEAALATGDREAEIVAELALVRDDILLDDAGAMRAYARLLNLRPGDASATEAIDRSEAKRSKWKDLAQRYFTESKQAVDNGFKSSLLVSASEVAFRYGLAELEARQAREEPSPKGKKSKKKGKAPPKEGKDSRLALVEKMLGLLRDALELDPKNRRAGLLLERILRDEERWEELVKTLEQISTEVPTKEERVAALLRLARVLDRKLDGKDRSVAAYETILDLSPGHAEATRALVDWFTTSEQWDHLVSLYDGQLAGGGVSQGQESGVLVQIAMTHWKMRRKPEAAEPYFERLRKIEPAHPGMLSFFREWCLAKGEQGRLVQILTDAQRTLPDGGERGKLAAEIAGLAEEGANAQKAIEQWRTILRSEPTNEKAREALKRLYRQSGAFNHLADLLRSELERISPDDAKTRLPLLREIGAIYRESIKSDSALVTVLSQIIALDPGDRDAVRELARVYETLGRWRDLLTMQVRLAELEPDEGAKAELYRVIARRWLDQFSNVQNAVESYEKLREVRPDDREAIEKLKELYGKRRAYKQLFELYEGEVKGLEGAERRALLAEMARLAAERLDRGADAMRLYKKVLAEDPNDLISLDALEKQAERDKDYATVAEVLERRAELCKDDTPRLVVLQKLGAVYSDRLQDHEGSRKTWRRVLDLSPGHQKALRVLRDSHLALGDYDGLTALYAETSDWEGLVDVLNAAADRVTDDATKVDLSFRTAEVLETKLGARDRTFRSYERVLSVRPDDPRAAKALIAIYEAESAWAKLPALYEILLGHTKDRADKRALFAKLGEVLGTRLSDRASAFRYARKSYELSPTDEDALEALEGAARAAGDWQGLTEAIQARLTAKDASEEERRTLRMKLAEVSATHAGRAEDAIGAYRELIETNPEDDEAIAALDTLLRSAPDRRDDLRWLFRHRVKRASDRGTKIATLSEWALLEEEAFSAQADAAKLYREILEESPEDEGALRALARILLATGDPEGALEIFVRQRDLAHGAKRVAREIEIARLAMGPLKKPREALAAAKRALEEQPTDAEVIGVVEQLLPLAETRGEAAVVLEKTYVLTEQWTKQGEVLSVLIATAASKADRQALHMKLADVKEKTGDVNGAFEVVSRAAQDAPSELEIWDRLAVLANKTHHTQQFVEAIAAAVPAHGESGLPLSVELDLAERAATLYDEMLGDIDRAQPYLERILARDARNERAFLRLKQILTTREKWSELEALYERVVSALDDPSQRADRLMEVALIAEEITQDAPKAVRYYERILEIEPANDQAIFALDKLYRQLESWPKLGELLRKRIELAGPGDTSGLKLRYGTLLWEKLADPKAALDNLEEIVTNDSSVREARELVEQCLAHPDLRQRAAIVLEGVYVEREEMRDLVRVLEVRLEFATNEDERRDLLRRIAELKDERIGDDKGAFETFTLLLPIAPADADARARFLEIAGRLGREGEAANVLLDSGAKADAPQPRAEILGEVARIFERRNEVERAEHVLAEVVKLAPDDPQIAVPAARALERIYTAGGKNAELAGILKLQIGLEENVGHRRELLARLGRLAEETLKDDADAIAAWKKRLEDDPADADALSALDRLYHRKGDHRALVEVLRAREQGASDADSRKELVIRKALSHVELAETAEAILAYRAVLDDFGADRAILGALMALYEKSEQWPDLAEALESDLALATEAADRIGLLTRLGDVRKARLSETPAAIEAYRQALEIDPTTPAARAALEALLDDENVRAKAADILRPLYEVNGAEAKLLRVVDIQIEAEESLDERLSLLARAADTAEGPLADPAKAFSYAARGLREAAAEASVGEWLERSERLAGRAEAWGDLVALFREVVRSIPDEDRQLELTLRIGMLSREKLNDAALAKGSFVAALELRADEPRALAALEALYEEGAEHELLLAILERRADTATDDVEKRRLYYKEAKITGEALADRDRAIAAYEKVLDLSLDAPAIASLEGLYVASERWGDLVALYERELGAANVPAARRADLHHALGRVHETNLHEIERAFDEYEEALRLSQTHEATIASLERIMTEKTHASQAAEMLEPVYAARLDFKQVIVTLRARLEGSQDPDERRTLLRRLSKLHEEQEENYVAALDVTAQLLAEDVTDETTWGELERLARVANAPERLATIYATELEKVSTDEAETAKLALRTAEIFESLSNGAKALQFYERSYKFAPEEAQTAFVAIDRLLTKEGKGAERVVLYRGALEYRSDSKERLATLHAIATIEAEDLKDDEAAIMTFRQAVEVDETDVVALDALARLYTRRGRFRDLADLQLRRAEQSALPEEEATFRLELAKTHETHLSDATAAVDELETVLGLAAPPAPLGLQAVRALEALLVGNEDLRARIVGLLRPVYERSDDWGKLVEVGKHSYALATTPEEKVAVLRETAMLLEQRGGDVVGAFQAVKEAFGLDPDDGDTREELDRLAVATRRWDDLAAAYEQGIARTNGVGQRELLEALARLHDKRRDDPRAALAAWERLFALDESDPKPLDEMGDLAMLLSDWSVVVRVLAKRADLTNDDEERASLWRRIGEARRDMLGDPQGAIDAYERALELEPKSSATLDWLIALVEEKNDAARLVDLYRRRVEECGEDESDRKHELLIAAARCYEVGLEDRREAIVLLTQALESKPDDLEVTRRLAGLYEAEKIWPELLDNLRRQIQAETETAARIALEKRLAKLFATELDDSAGALTAYRSVLVHGYDEEATRAVRQIGEDREELRREASEILEPVLAEAKRHDELADTLEMRLRGEVEPAARAATLRRIAQLSEKWLADLTRAETALLRAIAETPGDAELHADIERVAQMIGKDGWERYADALAERAGSIFEATITAGLFLRLGTVSEMQLSDLPRAAEAYARSAEQGGDDVAVLSALERVYAGLDDTRALAEVLERRISIENDPRVQADLYHRLAALQIEALRDKAQGLATLRLALERVPEHQNAQAAVTELLADDALFDDAWSTLEGVYRSTNRGSELGRLFARRVDRAETTQERTRARIELAGVLEKEGADPVAAQTAIEEAVAENPYDAEPLAELERLAEKNVRWAEAAKALERALVAHDKMSTSQSAPNISTLAAGAELWARLARWLRDRVGDANQAEAAYGRAAELDPENIEFVRPIEQLRRGPGRERDRIVSLRRLAKLEGDPEQKREVVREAAAIAENVVQDAKLAEEVLRELLAENEADAWAAAELTRLREAAGDDEEVLTLLLKRAEQAPNGVELRHRAAEIAETRIGDKPRAIRLFEEIFEHDRTDKRAQDRLRALYASERKDQELVQLLGQLVEVAESSPERATLRMEMARIYLEKLSSVTDAIETLRAVLDEEPDHEAAAELLASTYETNDKFAELADLKAALVERARAASDLTLEIERSRELGRILETKLKDDRRALETYEAILERSPSQVEALEAVARIAEARSQWDKAAGAVQALAEQASGETAVALYLRLAKAREQLGDETGMEVALEKALAADPAHAGVRDRLAALYERTKNWGPLAGLLVGNADLIRDGNPPYDPPPVVQSTGSVSRMSVAPGMHTSVAPPPAVPPYVTDQTRLLRRAAEIHLKERGSAADAVPILERATTLVPSDRELLLALVDAYNAANRERDAALVLERVIASFGGRRTKELSLYHHRLGRALASLGDKDVALTQLDMAFKIDPGSIEVLRDLGVLALETNDLERAQKTFRALLLQRLDAAAGISKGEVFYYLGEISMKQGDRQKAVQMLERAVENQPDLTRARDMLTGLKASS